MKTRKRVTWTLLTMLLVIGLLAGCGSLNATGDKTNEGYDAGIAYDAAMEEEGFVDEAPAAEYMEQGASDTAEEPAEAALGGANQSVGALSNSSQKIIKRYNFCYETEHFDKAFSYLKERVGSYEGYVSSSEVMGTSYDSGYRTLQMTARIPAENSEEFVSGLGELGTIVRQSETAEDVTLQYSDTESRIETLKTEQERLLDLLEKADSLEVIITLEDRLTEVRYELENYQSRKKLYDNLISYSTVEITLEEVNYTVEVDDSTFFSRVLTGLERSFRDIASDFISFMEGFIINLPYFVVWGIIIFVIVQVFRKLNKKRREKKLRKQQEKAVKQTPPVQQSSSTQQSEITKQ